MFLFFLQIKTNIDNGKSKGFGFIRYSKYDAQLKALASRHRIDGRWCDVKIPASKVTDIPHSLVFNLFHTWPIYTFFFIFIVARWAD